jgi:phage protein D
MMGAALWADATDLTLEVRVEVGGVMTSLIEGLGDRVTVDPMRGIVEVQGRDRTSLLIEARTQETFANLTSSEIATTLAARHELAADVAPTSTPVGRYWQLEHDRTTLNQFCRASTEWDLLIGLAGRESFDVWVTGDTLHFRPPPGGVATIGAVLRPVATFLGLATVSDLRLERSLTLAGDIEVVVKSWSSRLARGFVQTARASRGSKAGGGRPQRYVYILPDLTPDAASQIAQQRLRELTRHERVVVADMPGDVTLDPRAMVRVEGTGSAFDQDYFIDTIERSLDARGFHQTVRARNISPGVEVQ